jgi:hypothetical protein
MDTIPTPFDITPIPASPFAPSLFAWGILFIIFLVVWFVIVWMSKRTKSIKLDIINESIKKLDLLPANSHTQANNQLVQQVAIILRRLLASLLSSEIENYSPNEILSLSESSSDSFNKSLLTIFFKLEELKFSPNISSTEINNHIKDLKRVLSEERAK